MPKRPIRFFNTTGQCDPDKHYMLPPAERLQGAQLRRYVKDELYWMLHAPRQTGKTTFLQSWMKEINAGDEAIACYVNVERCQGMAEINEAMPNLCEAIQDNAKEANLPVPQVTTEIDGFMLSDILSNWAAIVAPKPLVVLFDNVDYLQELVRLNFLLQIKSGFLNRGTGIFPNSIGFACSNNMKLFDFNKLGYPKLEFILDEKFIEQGFSQNDITKLFAQRTEETGQQIEPSALYYVWEQSKGQPWLVNNLFNRATMEILAEDDYQAVTLQHVQKAREQIIQAQETHLDALAFRLNAPRIHNIVSKLLTGDIDLRLVKSDDFRTCTDLGLVSCGRNGITVANPIYQEVLAREISYGSQMMMPKRNTFRWQKPDGTLDMDSLLKEFQKFWRKHSEVWESKSDYSEAFPHLLLMAFLQRITNGDGRIEREYAAGRGRMDLFIEYASKEYIVEIKLVRDYDTLEDVKEDGIEQILSYRDKFNKTIPCYLMIFDRRSEGKKTPWEQRITWNVEGDVTVAGC